MSGFSYLILGTGVGRAIGSWLLRQPDTDDVDIADMDGNRAWEAVIAARKASQMFCRPPECSPKVVDVVRDENELPRLFRNYDVVISAIPAMYDPIITRACIKAGVHSCNLGAVLESTKTQLEMDEAAKEAGSSIATDTGVDPGLMNAWIQALWTKSGYAPDVIRMWAGGVPQRPVPPTNYSKMYAAEGTWHMVFDDVIRVRHGKIDSVNAIDTFSTIPTPQVLKDRGFAVFPEMESFESSGAALAPWDMCDAGVKTFTARTVRWPGFEHFVRSHGEEEFKEAFAQLPPTNDEHPDILYARVAAEWKNGTRATYEIVTEFDHETGFSAMQKTTGIPAAITARMLAGGRLPVGVDTTDRLLKKAGLTRMFLDEAEQYLPIIYSEE